MGGTKKRIGVALKKVEGIGRKGRDRPEGKGRKRREWWDGECREKKERVRRELKQWRRVGKWREV